MYYPNEQAMQYSAQEKAKNFQQEAQMARAIRQANPQQRSMMSKVRNYMAHMMHKMADAVAADKAMSAYDQA